MNLSNKSPLLKMENKDSNYFVGEIRFPDGYAYLQRECGDSIEVYLAIRNKRVQRARFLMQGCQSVFLCASTAMALAENSTLGKALQINAKQIDEALSGLPASEQHCAEFAALALKKALQDYLTRGKDSWKKMYPR